MHDTNIFIAHIVCNTTKIYRVSTCCKLSQTIETWDQTTHYSNKIEGTIRKCQVYFCFIGIMKVINYPRTYTLIHYHLYKSKWIPRFYLKAYLLGLLIWNALHFASCSDHSNAIHVHSWLNCLHLF